MKLITIIATIIIIASILGGAQSAHKVGTDIKARQDNNVTYNQIEMLKATGQL